MIFAVLSALTLLLTGYADQDKGGKGATNKSVELLNVSYNPTRELYQEYNV